MPSNKYLSYLLNPLELLRTKKVLQVNPTVVPSREEPEAIKIFVYDFDAHDIAVRELDKVSDCFSFIDSPKVTWINVDGLRKVDVESICNHYGIHYLIIEDILSIGQRPKMDDMEGLVFCVLNMLYFNEKDSSIESEQISIVLGKNFVISFQEDAQRDVFNPLREKLKINLSKVRANKADFLFYSLIDLIVDNYFVVMEKFGEKIELLEEDILRNADTRSLAKINILRKEMIVLKRSIAPVRELVNGILRSENELIEERTEKYFKDVYDHIVQANDLCENYRDMMMNLHDLYLNNVNLKMNEVMKVMAVVTCLLAPATVIGGIFGMNFEQIPLLHNKWGFFISVALMLFIPIVMIRAFRRRGWF
ncbi:magnesium/cobalt transporter CorA [Ferruginibacter lapsinanis]|uniref:magnesium/cobalt transporter CorA n=1 Tax=Ferruginibacter lapsinanis TaxID=563172 RepID=UPI001E5390EC|nr:magnesium/cobalt transporter CorA [Ferruginibacter lapsinanis]UEG50813.1 magnesium/cobalt transporter CorA [Ferruginibacter lapsinanis]